MFTPEELAAMRAADEEIERDFCITPEEIQVSRERDADARYHDKDAAQKNIAQNKREYYRAHREEIARYQAEYYRTHREKIARYQVEYYRTHREEINARRREYYRAHREQFTRQKREYRQRKKAERRQKDEKEAS